MNFQYKNGYKGHQRSPKVKYAMALSPKNYVTRSTTCMESFIIVSKIAQLLHLPLCYNVMQVAYFLSSIFGGCSLLSKYEIPTVIYSHPDLNSTATLPSCIVHNYAYHRVQHFDTLHIELKFKTLFPVMLISTIDQHTWKAALKWVLCCRRGCTVVKGV